MVVVTIQRKKSVTGALTPFDVYVDDVARGQLKNGEAAEFIVPEGEHTLSAQMAGSGRGSRQVTFTASEAVPVHFYVGQYKYYFIIIAAVLLLLMFLLVYFSSLVQLTFAGRTAVLVVVYMVLNFVMRKKAIVITQQ